MYPSFNCNGMMKDVAVRPNGHHPEELPEQVNCGALTGRHLSIQEGFFFFFFSVTADSQSKSKEMCI